MYVDGENKLCPRCGRTYTVPTVDKDERKNEKRVDFLNGNHK
jgi:hypothetical protein